MKLYYMRKFVRILALMFFLAATSHAQEPTNALEAEEKAAKSEAEKSSRQVEIEKRYAAWVETLPPAEQAWERVLQENLGGFYLPIHKAEKVVGRSNAWDFVAEQPGLPRVLLIGDSVSRGYTQDVRTALQGKANVHRAPENCGPTANGLKKLNVWLGDGKWDLIHFNFGIHDRRTPVETYTANLEKIVTRLEATGATLLWANTTPPADATNHENFSPEDCDRLNAAAAAVMKKHGIATDDVFSEVKPRLSELQGKSNVHFNAKGYRILGQKVAAEILKTLGAKKATGSLAPVEKDVRVQPEGPGWRLQKAEVKDAKRPRVLLIGDSILNGYYKGVENLLKDKAYVDAWVNPYCQSERFNSLLAEVLTKNGPYDVVHFNLGLHGWQEGRIKDGTFIPLTKALVEVIRKVNPNAKIIWANTTPVTVKGEPEKLDPEINPIIIEHNRMAAGVMKEMGVTINDFYGLLVDKLKLAHGDQFHWKPEAYKILANATARELISKLGAK